MIVSALFAASFALQAPEVEQKPTRSALNSPVWTHDEAVTLVGVSAADQVSLPIEWVSAPFFGSNVIKEIDPETGQEKMRHVGGRVEKVLSMPFSAAADHLSGLSGLQQSKEVSLPKDGTLVLAWDVASTEVQIQMGRDFLMEAAVSGAYSGPYSNLCYQAEQTPRVSYSQSPDGQMEVVERFKDGDPPPLFRCYVIEPAEKLIARGTRVSVGHLELTHESEAEGEEAKSAATFSALAKGKSISATLHVAKSKDGSKFFLWYSGEIPQEELPE